MSKIIGSIMDLGISEGTALVLAAELQKGWRYNRATTAARERAAAAEAKAMRENRKRGGSLRPVLCIDQQQYFEISAKYGYEAFADKGFIRDMQRLCPETAIEKV
jgi:hypothetical protein